jgi:4-diphosphocytidyl-2-C-methyl-D-erythritol kinase
VIEARAYAKINWSLRITGKRADGYHDLETVFQTISLHDTLIFRDSGQLTLTCDDPSIPVDDTNLVLRAARALGKTAAIELRKRIPAGGGLGGGSSDAAATLRVLGEGRDDLARIALELGSDVPFFLVGGTAYATGRGELLTPMPPIDAPLLLVLPEERMLTKDAFARITRYSEPQGIDAHRNAGVSPAFQNDFEEPVFAMFPRLREYKQRLYDAGATWAGMSGSGSTIVGRFADAAARDGAAARFSDVRVERAETITAA